MCQISLASFPSFSALSGRIPRKSPRKRDVSQVCSQKRGKFAEILRGTAPKPERSRRGTGEVFLRTAQIPARPGRCCGKLTKILTTTRCWSAKESPGTAKNVSPERQRWKIFAGQRTKFSQSGGDVATIPTTPRGGGDIPRCREKRCGKPADIPKNSGGTGKHSRCNRKHVPTTSESPFETPAELRKAFRNSLPEPRRGRRKSLRKKRRFSKILAKREYRCSMPPFRCSHCAENAR